MKKSDLVHLVVERAGISESQAETAVDVVLQQLKKRLPPPVATQITGFLEGSGEQDGSSSLGDIAKRADGMFGQ